MASERGAVTCRACGAALGRLNDPRRYAGAAAPGSRVVTLAPGVRLFVDLAFRRVELHCPHCGACGRTLDAGKFRGVAQVA